MKFLDKSSMRRQYLIPVFYRLFCPINSFSHQRGELPYAATHRGVYYYEEITMNSRDKLRKLMQLKLLIQTKEQEQKEKQLLRQETIEIIRRLGQEIGDLRTRLMDSI